MNLNGRNYLCLILQLILLSGCQSGEFGIGQAETINEDIVEPSGIVFHAERGTLFVVGDEGTLAEMSLDGETLHKSFMFGVDLEGITYNPNNGLLYAIVEGDNMILEIKADDLQVQRRFLIGHDFKGTAVLQPGNNGIEGITFLPDRQHREGGVFYVTHQGLALSGASGSGYLFEIEAPLQTSLGDGGSATILDFFILEDHGDLSGIHYDEPSDSFYIISDSLNELLIVTRGGAIENVMFLPGEEQEGIAFDQDGYLYIAQDSGTIVKFWTHGKR